MTSPIYRQNDSRWSGLPYPSKPYTIGRSGCGNCAVNHCVMEMPKYANYTPASTRKVMLPYATRGNGTKWAGIKAGLEHYGYKVKQLSASTMTPVWEELNKGNRIGVIRMVKGRRGGVTWTSSGHYIMFQGYKVKNGKHYFKIKDSGRGNNGWFSYEDTMKGMFGPIWIAERKDPKIMATKKYKGELPTTTLKLGSKGEEVKKWQRFLNHVYGEVPKANPVTVDGKFGLKTDAWTGCFQYQNNLTEDSVVGNNTLSKARTFGE